MLVSRRKLRLHLNICWVPDANCVYILIYVGFHTGLLNDCVYDLKKFGDQMHVPVMFGMEWQLDCDQNANCVLAWRVYM